MRVLLLCCAFFLSISNSAFSQSTLSNAQTLATQGKFDAAIVAYSQIIAASPNNTDAMLGRAYAYSWDREFVNASADFNAVLAKQPANREAQKGMAYVYLWSGDTEKAIQSFNSLISLEPNNKDFYIARGQAQMSERQLKAARLSFQKARDLDANDREPKLLLAAVRKQPTIFDLDVLGGISNVDGESKGGLRFVQLSSQVSKHLNLAVKYDNTLSMDNLRLITQDRSIPFYSGSLFYSWNKHTATKFEGGYRDLNGSAPKVPNVASGESQFSLEQIAFLEGGTSLKLGGAVINPNVGKTAFLLLAGVHHPFTQRFTAGLNYFFANRNVFNTTENRVLIDADINLNKGNMLSAGLFYGRSNSDIKAFTGNTSGGYLKGYFPVSNQFGLHAGISAENNFFQDLFNVNAGFRFRLEK